MKEKIKRIKRWLLDNWTKIAEIGTVYWAVSNIVSQYSTGFFNREYHVSPVLAYFSAAVLILYLLRKYEGKS